MEGMRNHVMRKPSDPPFLQDERAWCLQTIITDKSLHCLSFLVALH